MSTKTVSIEPVVDESIVEPIVEPVVVPIEPVVIVPVTCGHINKQFINTDGQREDLVCTLKSEHAGDHQAPHQSLQEFSGTRTPTLTYKIFNGKDYRVDTVIGYWGDAAGKNVEFYAADLAEKRAALAEFTEANPGNAEAHKQRARELGLIPKNRA